MANQLTPPPLDNDPKPIDQTAADKLRAWISDPTWQNFKSWVSLVYRVLKGVSNDGKGNITFPGNINLPNGGVTTEVPGQFTNTAQINPNAFNVNNLNFATEWFFEHPGLGFDIDALAGGVNVPAGATISQATGVSGYVVNGSTGTAAVGGYFQARSTVTGAAIWSINTVVDDNTFASTVIGYEMDVGCKNAGSTVNGLAVTGVFGNLNPVSVGVQVGILAPATNSGRWTHAFLTIDGTTSNAFSIGSIGIVANSDGQTVTWNTYDNGNVLRNVSMQAVHTTAGANLNIILPSTSNTVFTNGQVTCAQATSTGQAVTLDQHAASQSNKQVIGSPAINTNYDITVSLTAPSKGSVALTGVYNGTTATGAPTISLLSNGSSVASDSTGQATQVEVAAVAVTKGTAYTFTCRVATGGTAPGAFSEAILMSFTPTT